MNWGKSIALVFIVFAGFIGTMVFWMSRQQVDLVRDDYYQDELAYQQHIDRVANARHLDPDAYIQVDAPHRQVHIVRPDSLLQGTLLLYCPANRRADIRLTLSPAGSATTTLAMQNRPAGLWRAQLTWSDGQRSYYTERSLQLP